MKITVTGPASAWDHELETAVVDPKRLSQLDGLQYSDDLCVTYLDDDLAEIGLVGGAIRLAFESLGGPLKVITEYQSPRRLKPSELKRLMEYTVGQWSDGIGEGSFAHRDRLGMDVELFPRSGKAEVE